MMQKVIGMLTIMLALSACGLTENMDSMKETTDTMLDQTRGLKDLTCSLYRGNRQGVSQAQRRDAIKIITDSVSAIESRFKNAAVYFRGFEMQLWEELSCDTPMTKEQLYGDAVEELMIELRGVIAGKRPKIDPLSTDPKLQALFAMAATVEQINTIQVEAAATKGFTPASLLDLIVTGLQRKPILDEDETAGPYYAQRLLGYEDEALYLLELRYNIYPAILVDKIFDITQMGLIDKLKLALKKQVVVDLTQLNAMELRELVQKYIYGALYVRNVRRDLGAPIAMEKSLRKILKKAVLKEDPLAGTSKRLWSQRLKAGIELLLCESAVCPGDNPDDREIARLANEVRLHSGAPYFADSVNNSDKVLSDAIRDRLAADMEKKGYSASEALSTLGL